SWQNFEQALENSSRLVELAETEIIVPSQKERGLRIRVLQPQIETLAESPELCSSFFWRVFVGVFEDCPRETLSCRAFCRVTMLAQEISVFRAGFFAQLGARDGREKGRSLEIGSERLDHLRLDFGLLRS